jgi:hypothetical protein
MARLGSKETLTLFKEAKRYLKRCAARAERSREFKKELEARLTRARVNTLAGLIEHKHTNQGSRKVVIMMLEYAVKDNSDDPVLCAEMVDLHNRLYPEMEWTGEW